MKTAAAVGAAVIAGVFGQAIAQKMINQGAGWVGFLLVGAVVFAVLLRPKKKAQEREHSSDERSALVKKQQLTDLMLAAADGNLTRLSELIQAGADVNARSAIGTTALMYAARNNHPECISALLAAGADRTAATDSGSTALSFARNAGHTESIAALAKE
jgi:hypothetical protein